MSVSYVACVFCLCVCLSTSLSLQLHDDVRSSPVFCMFIGSCLGLPLAALWYVMYFLFYGWRHVCEHWPRIGEAKNASTQSDSRTWHCDEYSNWSTGTQLWDVGEVWYLSLPCCSPVWARERCRISPPRFLAECCKRQLNQGSFAVF